MEKPANAQDVVRRFGYLIYNLAGGNSMEKLVEIRKLYRER